MKYYSTKIHTRDLSYSAAFYTETLGLPITCRYEHCILLDNYLLLSQDEQLPRGPVCIYFETEDYNETEEHILSIGHSPDYRYSPVGQRIMILRDPDGNTVEIGESMNQIVSELLALSCSNR